MYPNQRYKGYAIALAPLQTFQLHPRADPPAQDRNPFPKLRAERVAFRQHSLSLANARPTCLISVTAHPAIQPN